MIVETIEEKRRLADLYVDLFLLATQLRGARDYGDPEKLRDQIIGLFNKAEREGKDLGLFDQTLKPARYALAAFLDEIILGIPGGRRDEWSTRPLQYEFFGEYVAGVEFFNRLEQLRRGLPATREVLEVYALCLLLGFEGQYKLQEKEKLRELTEGVLREIEPQLREAPSLSPHAGRPDEFIELVKQGVPTWVATVTCVAVAFFFYLALSFMIGHEAKSTVEEIKQTMDLRR